MIILQNTRVNACMVRLKVLLNCGGSSSFNPNLLSTTVALTLKEESDEKIN